MPNKSASSRRQPAATDTKHLGGTLFAVGAFGGIAPTLLRFAIDLSQQRITVAAFNLSVLVGVALFGFLGGGMAAIWRESDLKKVFYIGLGLPSLLTVLSSSATAPKLVPSTIAYVQPGAKTQSFNEGTEQAQLRRIGSFGTSRLKVILPTEIGYANAVAIFTGPELGESEDIRSLGTDGEVVIPPYEGLSVRIVTPLAGSAALTVPWGNYQITEMKFTASKNAWAGFLYAIGAHTKAYDLVLESSKTTALPKPDHLPV
ncbi:MAG: hypothetical protein JWQ49_6711 [Edaphobacter sp.]|nr:hypothetical protein [Edaphobacter sp.]